MFCTNCGNQLQKNKLTVLSALSAVTAEHEVLKRGRQETEMARPRSGSRLVGSQL
jgi:hypothetical protein